jgi:hypothetical protein
MITLPVCFFIAVPINAMRGLIIGVMIFVGGIFHTLPFLITNFYAAVTLAFVVVGLELIAIAYIRYHYFNMHFWMSVFQVILGGGLVLAAALLIGNS